MKNPARLLVIALVLSGSILSAEAGPKVLVKTSQGDITIELNEEKAPETVKNFLVYVNEGFFDNTVFHRVIKDFDVRKGKPDPEARSLSGGNLQKFVSGREILQNPTVLAVDQPTWGVDAAAAAAIRQALLDLARGGAAVICISQDLDELMEISDRFAALDGGRLSPPRPARGLTVDEIGLMLGGAQGQVVAHAPA